MVGAAQIAARFALAFALAASASAQDFRVEGSCRDGYPHGLYELRDGKGAVRAVGAFNRGKRTGSFLFWTAGGAREAQLPFDEDLLSGTVAMWWPAAPRAEARPRIEASYSRGKRAGTLRTWYASGKPKVELQFEAGELRAARASTEGGGRLAEAAARALAERETADADARIASLMALIDANLPHCEPASDRLEKT